VMSQDAIMIRPEVSDLSLASAGRPRARIIVAYSPSGPRLLGHSLS